MSKPIDNIDFIKEFMSFGSPLRQGFIIEAIDRYAKQLDSLTDDKCKELNENGSFVNMTEWREIGRDYLRASKEFYNN